MSNLVDRFVGLENVLHRALVRYSIPALRIAVGAVFLGFGILKFFPGISPAQGLAEKTTDLLTFGLIPGGVAIVGIATLECFIGICFLAGRWMRLAIWLLALEFVGILSPIVLLTGRLFSGPHNAPTLEGQYVLKDIILVGAGMVIAAASFRGGRLVRHEPPELPHASSEGAQGFATSEKLGVVLSATGSALTVQEVCHQHGISQATYYEWRDALLHGATTALDEHGANANGTISAR